MHSPVRLLLATTLAATLVLPTSAGAATIGRQIAYHHWASATQLATGSGHGASVEGGALTIDNPYRQRTFGGTTYDVAKWTSPKVTPGFAFTELVPSWVASTPAGTWIQVQVRGVTARGVGGSWDVVARWASGDGTIARTSLGPQRDDIGHMATDTWEANGTAFVTWQLQVALYRHAGTTATPHVDSLGAMVSALPSTANVSTSAPGVARGITLAVPRYSQMTHTGEYPKYGGGGEAWCSPTSTTMVLAYYKALPPPSAYAWVNQSYDDRFVDHAARMTFDNGYDGTGNWPFNTAYAGTRTRHAFVTRFKSLRGVERFVKVGIPVVTSISFATGKLSGAPIAASAGHLVVVVGFTRSGDVVVNDPAARTDSTVRRTYDRGQFEDAWLKRYTDRSGTHGSGGLAYVIYDATHPLPARQGNTNW